MVPRHFGRRSSIDLKQEKCSDQFINGQYGSKLPEVEGLIGESCARIVWSRLCMYLFPLGISLPPNRLAEALSTYPRDRQIFNVSFRASRTG